MDNVTDNSSSDEKTYETAFYVAGVLPYRRVGNRQLAPLPLRRAENPTYVSAQMRSAAMAGFAGSVEEPPIDEYILDLEEFAAPTTDTTILTEVEIDVRLSALANFNEAFMFWEQNMNDQYASQVSWSGCAPESIMRQASFSEGLTSARCVATKIAFAAAALGTVGATVSGFALLGIPEPFVSKTAAATAFAWAKGSAWATVGFGVALIDCIRDGPTYLRGVSKQFAYPEQSRTRSDA